MNVVLLSGGIDSTTLATEMWHRFGHDNVLALSVHYGQRHDRELASARSVAAFLGMKHEQIQVAPLGGTSSLTDHDAAVPEIPYSEIQGVSPTYVPFRNAILLSYAVSKCMETGGGVVAYGAHAEDAEGWAYPDCTPEFAGAFAAAAYIGTYHEVRVEAPYVYSTKSELITKGFALAAPYHLTWSCYAGGDVPCGRCSTCLARADAFKEAGHEDPALKVATR